MALEGDHFTVFQSEGLAKMAEKIAATLAGPCVAGTAAGTSRKLTNPGSAATA